MPHLLFPGLIGLIILGFFALKTIEGGGDWLDFLNCTARYEAARTDFDFMLMFGMVAIFVVGLIGLAVYKAQVEAPAPVYQAETSPVSIAQHKSAHTGAHAASHTASHTSAHAASHTASHTSARVGHKAHVHNLNASTK